MRRVRQADLRDMPRRTRRVPELPARGQGRSRHRDAPADPGSGPAPARAARACAVRRRSPRRRTRSNRARSSRLAIRSGRWPCSRCSTANNRARCGAKRCRRSGSTSASGVSGGLLWLIAQVPFLGFSAWVLVPLLPPTLSRRERLLRHQDVERRRGARAGGHELARRALASERRELAIAPQKRARRVGVIDDRTRIGIAGEERQRKLRASRRIARTTSRPARARSSLTQRRT